MGYVRFWLAVSVALYHSGGNALLPLIGGQAAVECFFLISGFYMAATYERNYGADHWVQFLVSRYVRLYPFYLASVLATAFVYYAGRYLGHTFQTHLGSFHYFAHTGTPDIPVWTMLFQDIVATDPRRLFYLPVRQAWSISAELAFYSLVPILFAWRQHLVPAVILSVALKAVLFYSFGPQQSYYPFYGQLCYFIGGMLLFERRSEFQWGRNASYWLVGAFIVSTICVGESSFEGAIPLIKHFWLIATLVFLLPSSFTIKNRVDTLLGDASYGLYLIHFLVLEVLLAIGYYVPGHEAEWSSTIPICMIVIGVSTAIALTFERFVQRPIDGWRRRYFYRQ
jgi:peptidoglycan/LPS O-acetylase OafA/YrhL